MDLIYFKSFAFKGSVLKKMWNSYLLKFLFLKGLLKKMFQCTIELTEALYRMGNWTKYIRLCSKTQAIHILNMQILKHIFI